MSCVDEHCLNFPEGMPLYPLGVCHQQDLEFAVVYPLREFSLVGTFTFSKHQFLSTSTSNYSVIIMLSYQLVSYFLLSLPSHCVLKYNVCLQVHLIPNCADSTRSET